MPEGRVRSEWRRRVEAGASDRPARADPTVARRARRSFRRHHRRLTRRDQAEPEGDCVHHRALSRAAILSDRDSCADRSRAHPIEQTCRTDPERQRILGGERLRQPVGCLDRRRRHLTPAGTPVPAIPTPERRSLDRHSRSAWSHDDVSQHADAILGRLKAGTMPCDGAWPPAQVTLLERWVESGKPR